MKPPELLAPAGNFEKLQTAIHYGADAVYLGGKQYSLRAHATNFSEEDLQAAVTYAHDHNVKVYVTVNILAHNDDFDNLPDYLTSLKNAQVDGLIISDPGILLVAKDVVPEIPIHLSTQANVTNLESARFWTSQGLSRINTARELSLAELIDIKKANETEIEVFVHGALCISYSGRCMLSLYLTDRDANQGDCAHPCRYLYRLEEEKRPGQFFPVEEDNRGTYIFNSKDLCLLNKLPDLIAAEIDSLKIEGRMKSVYYVGAIVRLYRAALDYIAEHDISSGPLPSQFMEELVKIGSRGYTENFLDSPPDTNDMLYEGPKINQHYAPIGIVRQTGASPVIEARNPFKKGDQIEYLGSNLENSSHEILSIHTEDGGEIDKANPNSLVTLRISPSADHWKTLSLLRRKIDSSS